MHPFFSIRNKPILHLRSFLNPFPAHQNLRVQSPPHFQWTLSLVTQEIATPFETLWVSYASNYKSIPIDKSHIPILFKKAFSALNYCDQTLKMLAKFWGLMTFLELYPWGFDLRNHTSLTTLKIWSWSWGHFLFGVRSAEKY